MPKIINSSQIKIINEIYKNPGINLRGIIEKTRLSPNYVSGYVNMLVKRGIAREEKLEKKRVYLRRFFINSNKIARNFFSLIKDEEKEVFYKKYKKLEPVLGQLSKLQGVEFILVYGSYARFAANKDSDLDLLIVGKINKTRVREILVSLDLEVSIKIETLLEFKKRIDDSIHKQIIRDNILIYDLGEFVDIMLGGRK